MAYDYCVRSEKHTPSNPDHPDLKDPYRDMRMLVRKMRPEEEAQRPYDFGNVRQAQLAVDGYASKMNEIMGRGGQTPSKTTKTGQWDYGTKSNKSKATRPDGWQTMDAMYSPDTRKNK